MQINMSNYLEEAILNMTLRGTGWSEQPSGTYLGLFTSFTQASDGDVFTEVSGNGYARRSISWAASAGGYTNNTSAISFPAATANWGTITHVGVFSALSGGNLLYWAELPTPTAVLSMEQYEVSIGDLEVLIEGTITTYFANRLIEATLRAGSIGFGNTYVALLSAFTSDSVYTEVSDDDYTRLAPTFGTPSSGTTTLTSELVWEPSVNGYNVTHVAVFDAATGGNMLYRSPLFTPKNVTPGRIFKLGVGSASALAD